MLLSIGHPSYAAWTQNMIVSLKANCSLPVHLVTDNYLHCDIADKVIKIQYEDCHIKGKLSPALAKLSLWKYSEFDETIFLDVDGLIFKDLADIQFTGDFHTIVNGYSSLELDNRGVNLWVEPKLVYEKYDIPEENELPGTNSSFMYWKDSTVFEQALMNFSNPVSIAELRYKWGRSNAQPDELYLNVALAQLGIRADIEKPLYTSKRREGVYLGFEKIKAQYYGICCWGGLEFNSFEISGTGDIRSGLYNNLMREYYQKVYGEDCYQNHFYTLIKNKIYEGVL